jgi:uncharacterized protein YigA (DUF484 family)
MGIKQRKWQAHLKAAQASGLSLVDYAARRGINVRRLYEARHARARVQAAQSRKASAFARIKVKSGLPVKREADAHQSRAVATLAMQARLGNGVILIWTHDASNASVLADLMHTLAALPCSA